MNQEILINTITIILILSSLPILLIILFYNKININDSYKKLMIILWITLNLLWIYSIITLYYIDDIINDFSEWNYKIIIILFPLIILLGFTIFYIIRILLWKIEIKIFWDNFTSWDKLTWEINLKLKKNIQNANLYVYLRWYEYIYSGWTRWGWSWKIKYENKIILEKEKNFDSNYNKTYDFNFNIPYLKKDLPNNYEELLIKELDEKWLSKKEKEKALNFTKKLIKIWKTIWWTNNASEKLKRWKIEVRLEKKWIDLFNTKKVNIVRKLKD